jgi:hypothetical protein
MLPEELRRAAQGEAVLAEAMLTLARYQEEQARTAATLREREIWIVTALLERSAPLWRHLPSRTLRFPLDPTGAIHLGLGHVAHPATLIAPGAVKQAVPAAITPCWARVTTLLAQLSEGQEETCVHTCVSISTADAVATLGLGRILTQLELATRTAGQALLAEAQAQQERRAQLRRAERMLGWAPEPASSVCTGERAVPTLLLLLLLGPAGLVALGGTLWGLLTVMVCLLLGIPAAVLTMLLGGVGLLLWRRCHARRVTVDLWQ